MRLKIHPQTPGQRDVGKVAECLRNQGIVIFPTDSVYALGCDLKNKKGIERICSIVGKKPERANLSIICHDLSCLSEFSAQIDTSTFKMMKKALPGPYTFILNANSNVPKLFMNKKKTVGIRVPDNNIVREIVKEFGGPLVSTSLHSEDEILDYLTDIDEIENKFGNLVDIVVDGGPGDNMPSTIIDCTNGQAVVVREGKGELVF